MIGPVYECICLRIRRIIRSLIESPVDGRTENTVMTICVV